MNYFLAGTLQEPLRINGFQGSPLLVGSGPLLKIPAKSPIEIVSIGWKYQ